MGSTLPFDYLTALLEHASELSESPDKWMPWNYKFALIEPDNSEA